MGLSVKIKNTGKSSFGCHNLSTNFSSGLKKIMPCPLTGPKMFCAGPNFLSQPKNLFTYCASQRFCARQKDDLHSVKLVFVPAQKFLKRH